MPSNIETPLILTGAGEQGYRAARSPSPGTPGEGVRAAPRLGAQFPDTLLGIAERVLEAIGVLTVGDFDVQFAVDTGQFAGSRIGHDADRQRLRAFVHYARVVHHKGTGEKRPGGPLQFAAYS